MICSGLIVEFLRSLRLGSFAMIYKIGLRERVQLVRLLISTIHGGEPMFVRTLGFVLIREELSTRISDGRFGLATRVNAEFAPNWSWRTTPNTIIIRFHTWTGGKLRSRMGDLSIARVILVEGDLVQMRIRFRSDLTNPS
jgi:hypothetical protein